VQVFIQNKILTRSLSSSDQNPEYDLPFFLKVVQHVPLLQRLPARLFGLGFRPEHVDQLIIGSQNRSATQPL
jgi:hypothetical protein